MSISITIRSVATLAGVSQKTVSRVVNNEPGVTPGTRDKVKAAIAELGWTPNPAAIALRAGRATGTGNDSSETLRVDPTDLRAGDVVIRLEDHEESGCHCDVVVTIARRARMQRS